MSSRQIHLAWCVPDHEEISQSQQLTVCSERVFEDEEKSEQKDKGKAKDGPSGSKEIEEIIPDCTLAQEIQTVCRLIFNKG